jgi:RNA exonuclease 1
VSLLAHDGSLLLDALVKPAADILDYKTQFSGISEEMLSGVTTTLAQVSVTAFS